MKTYFKKALSGLAALMILASSAIALSTNYEADKNSNEKLFIPQEHGKYGKDSAQCIVQLSLYREFYKQWKASGYKSPSVYDAIGPWRWVFKNCPEASQNAYIDGNNMMEYFVKKSKTDEEKSKYVDSMMMIYDQRIKYFGREGYVLGRKGSDLIKNMPEEYEKAYHIFKKSVDLRGNKSESFVLVYYFRTVTKMVDDGKLEKLTVVEAYDQLSNIIDHNLKASQGDEESISAWENVKGNIELSFEPYATCEDLIPIFNKKFIETPDDIELLKKITNMLDKKDCTDSDLFFETSVKLNELEPSPTSSYMIAKMLLKKDKFNDAVPYLESALQIDDTNQKADVFLLLATVYRQQNNFIQSRTYARNALDLRPDDGNGYLMIGDMYAASANDCGDNDLTKKVAYWAAVDKYIQAKNVDPGIADIANKRIEIYSKQFPGSETIFFYDLGEGDAYTVGCWINENTKVRALK
ncbi:MAG: tetratricopeptide repeat protein [Bacteroidales bacterium]|nr:tetratricopeptide repeat protein [Bacteroidales bacterium]